MCSLFGLYDYKNHFNYKKKIKIISVLGNECEIRGTDATGISYVVNNHLVCYKRPEAAHLMKYIIPENTKVIMGHTRMSTQGSEKLNYNNHPFVGVADNVKFSLAHNGILHNDIELRMSKELPKTKIQTDSYIAVQLLEEKNVLNFDSVKYMSEEVIGNFCFTILDENNNLYLVKGENPLCIYHFKYEGFYLYASTEEILKKAVNKLGLFKGIFEKIILNTGEILKIDDRGKCEYSNFNANNNYYFNYPYFKSESEESHLDLVKSMSSYFGYTEDDIDDLLKQGFTLDEIEEYFYAFQ